MDVKAHGLTERGHPKLVDLSKVEGYRIPGVVVECVEIRRNTRGESGILGLSLTLRCESVGSERD